MKIFARIGLSVLIILAAGVAVSVFWERPVMQGIAALVGLAMLAPVWFVENLDIAGSLKSANHPSRIDGEAKALLDMIHSKFNERGIEEISRQTQGFIVAAMRRMKNGQINDEKKLMKLLNPIPASQFARARDVKFLAATVASYYFRADEDTDFGYKNRTRVNNFIAGVNDTSL